MSPPPKAGEIRAGQGSLAELKVLLGFLASSQLPSCRLSLFALLIYLFVACVSNMLSGVFVLRCGTGVRD